MLRAVTKISSCRVYAVSRWGTEEPSKESFWSNFPFVSYKKAGDQFMLIVAWGNPRPPALCDSNDATAVHSVLRVRDLVQTF